MFHRHLCNQDGKFVFKALLITLILIAAGILLLPVIVILFILLKPVVLVGIPVYILYKVVKWRVTRVPT